MIDRRLIACAVASFIGHGVIARALDELPPRPAYVRPARVEIRVVAPPVVPPEPEPPKPPEPAKPEPIERVVHEKPRARPKAVAPQPTQSEVDTPTPPIATTATDTTTRPTFGITMESTSQGGRMAAPVGNTGTPTQDAAAAGPVKPLAPVAAAHEVTKMPLPQGRCAGKYTEAARAAALEGVVILDLIVDETGRARDIDVVEGLGHGLTEAALAALRACRFTPGERNGTPVPVRVRGFKIRFLLQEGQ